MSTSLPHEDGNDYEYFGYANSTNVMTIGFAEKNNFKFVGILFLLTCLIGCVSYGPQTISRDRFNYGQAIADSWEEQMVFNMLRVRYGEAPIFLDVSQVINQYSLEGQAGLDAIVGDIPGGGSDAVGAQGSVRWADRPTITYSPLSGVRFTRSLLTPLAPEAVFTLIESGWPADLVLAVGVRSINGIRNEFSRSSQADPQFEPLLAAIARLQKSGVLEISVVNRNEQATVQIGFRREHVTDSTRNDISYIRTTLQLEPGQNEFALRYGARPTGKGEIFLQTRTMLQIMEELSYGIAVPPEHLKDGRTNSAIDSVQATSMTHRFFKVQYSLEEPVDALVAVQNRGYWFAIDDKDYGSKRILAFLMIMLNLAESDDENGGPVITIGAGV